MSETIIDAFRRVLGPAPDAPQGSTADIVIDANVVHASEMPSIDGWQMLETDDTGALWSTPTGGGATIGESIALFNERSAVFLFTDGRAVSLNLHTMITHALNHCAHLADLVPTHSALVGVDGIWFLVIGPSGTGKSTTCLAASRGGHLVAADDTCLLRVDDGRLSAHGIPRAPSLPLAAHGLGDERPVDHRERTSEPTFDLARGWHAVDAVLLLAHGDAADSQLGSVTTMRVIETMAASAAAALSAPVTVDAVPEVLRKALTLPARLLSLGIDPTQRLESTNKALIQAARLIETSR